MAEIKAFNALRFTKKAGDMKDLCCPPYDVISEEARLRLENKSEYNIVKLELPQGEDKYAAAGALTRKWLEEGVLACDDSPCIYVYEDEFTLTDGSRKITRGFTARIKLTPFSEGIVLPHEETLSKAKEDRFCLLEATGCSFSQIYSLYNDDDGAVRAALAKVCEAKPDEEFLSDDGVLHRVWAAADADIIDTVEKAMAPKQVFIADGHHRYETAINFKNSRKDPEEAAYAMMTFVDMDDPGLVVLPTHRLVKNLPDFDPEKAAAAMSEEFNVEKRCGGDIEAVLAENDDKCVFAMYVGGGNWYMLTLANDSARELRMPDRSPAYRALDVAVLHSMLLEPLFGIDKASMARQSNLTYTRSAEEAVEAVDSGEYQCAFIINATKISQIRDVAMAGDKMPQKSTFFYPKLITGAVMNKVL